MTILLPLPDYIRPDLEVLFVGINPGVRSALTGHHFAGASNRFWTLLHESGLVAEPIGYRDDARLPEWGYGITNIVARPTPGSSDVLAHEFSDGRARLLRTVRRYRPRVVALVGVTVCRAMFPERKGRIVPGRHAELIGRSAVYVLPNPSGRNAHYSHAAMRDAFKGLAEYLSEMRAASYSAGRL